MGAKIDVKPSDSSNSSITFNGPVAVTFGFAVQQIRRVGDVWQLHGASPSAEMAFGVGGMGMPDESAANPMVFETGEYDCLLDF